MALRQTHPIGLRYKLQLSPLCMLEKVVGGRLLN